MKAKLQPFGKVSQPAALTEIQRKTGELGSGAWRDRTPVQRQGTELSSLAQGSAHAVQLRHFSAMAVASPRLRQIQALQAMVAGHVGANALSAAPAPAAVFQPKVGKRRAYRQSIMLNPEQDGGGNVLQGQFTPYSFSDLGHAEPEGVVPWMEETIGNVVFHRVDNMVYTKTDGDNTGSIKHYVPYNWIMKNIADELVIGFQRDIAIVNLQIQLTSMGLAWPAGDPSHSRASFDAWMRDAVYLICDWEENLFRHSVSSGDGRGTRLDIPADPAVLVRVQGAAAVLGDLATPPLG